MSDRKKVKTIVAAVRSGLATNVRMGEGFLGSNSSDVKFSLPGDLRVIICRDRRSLQYDSETGSAAIGGPRAVRKVLAALVANGFEDKWNPRRPWDELQTQLKNATIATQMRNACND